MMMLTGMLLINKITSKSLMKSSYLFTAKSLIIQLVFTTISAKNASFIDVLSDILKAFCNNNVLDTILIAISPPFSLDK